MTLDIKTRMRIQDIIQEHIRDLEEEMGCESGELDSMIFSIFELICDALEEV